MAGSRKMLVPGNEWAKVFPADILKHARKLVALSHDDEGLASLDEYSFEIHDVAVYVWKLLDPAAEKGRRKVVEALR
jgi:hypothetical protein